MTEVRGGSISFKRFLTLLLIAAGSAAYYLFVYRPSHTARGEAAVTLAKSVEVVDTYAEVHTIVGRLKEGERVEVLQRKRNWVRVRLADGQVGWVERKNLVDAETYEMGQQLLKELERLPAQAVGHTYDIVSLRADPSREASQIGQLGEGQSLEIFGRRLVERLPPATPAPLPSSAASPASDSIAQEAWYLVRGDSKAGWALGRSVGLDIPESIGMYAQGTNLVAWVVLNAVKDDGQLVPQYFLADRVGTQEFDFNHIRVLTWWKKNHKYATAYVESNLNGYFPIRVVNINGTPYFRLRLVDSGGRKFQKIYELYDTLTRPLGTVEGWESDALPTRLAPERLQVRQAKPARKRRSP